MQVYRAVWLIEGGVLVAASPFLLFPTVYMPGTIVAMLLLVFNWIGEWWLEKRPFPPTPLNLPLLVFLLMFTSAILITADPHLTLPKTTSLLLGIALWHYLTRLNLCSTQIAWAALSYCLIGAGFTLLGALGANWLNKIPFLYNLLILLPVQLIRLPGADAGVHANELAGTILFYLPLLVTLASHKQVVAGHYQKWRMSPFILGCTLVTAAILLLTQSRSAWVGMLAGLVAIGVSCLPVNWQQKAAMGGGLFATIGLLLVGLVGPSYILAKLPASPVVGNLTFITFRQEVWHWAIITIQDFPFTGTGLGTFRQVVRRLYPLDVPATYDIAHAHNIFLQTALDVGLPGLIAYLAMLSIAGFMGWQVAKHNEQLRPFALGLLASLIAFHTYGLTDALALGSKPGILFWMALGLLTAMFNCSSEQASQRSS